MYKDADKVKKLWQYSILVTIKMKGAKDLSAAGLEAEVLVKNGLRSHS